MYLRAVGRVFTQMNAYFLLMNSIRCKHGLSLIPGHVALPLFTCTQSVVTF